MYILKLSAFDFRLKEIFTQVIMLCRPSICKSLTTNGKMDSKLSSKSVNVGEVGVVLCPIVHRSPICIYYASKQNYDKDIITMFIRHY